MTASDTVLEIIKENGENGVNFAEILDKTRFDEKKIRNIVFRLNKLGKIRRKNRGLYVAN
jgi:predicted transcriptional regulator of viral defense system